LGAEGKAEHDPPRQGDVRFSLADIERAKEILGYRPLVDLRRGLEETVAFFRA